MHQLIRCLLSCVLLLTVLSGCSRENAVQQAQDYLGRAESYRDQGQYRAAMIETANAMNAAPDEVRYPLAMAEIYNHLGAGRRASNLLEEYVESHAQSVALSLAEAYILQGRFLSAEEVLQDFQPETEEQERLKALYLADAKRIRGNLEDSEVAYETLLTQYPDDLELQLRLVENHLFRSKFSEAQAKIAPLLERYPNDSDVLHLGALVAFQGRDLEVAVDRLTHALINIPAADMMLPQRASILELLSEALTAQGRTAEALVYRKRLADESPDAFAAQEQLDEAMAAAETGDLEKAERLLAQLLEESPESQTAAIMLGMVNFRQGEFEEASPLLSRNVDVETANIEMIRATAVAQARTGQMVQALTMLDRALQARPEEPILNALYGMLALTQPEHEQSGYERLQKALSQDPHMGGIRLTLARFHFQRDEPEEAMAQLRRAFSYQPADWPVTHVYMEQLFSRGKLDEVAQALETLKEAAPRARQTALFEAQYAFRNASPEEGLEQMRALTESDPNYGRAHGVLAQMYHEQGQARQALNSLENLLALDARNRQALQAGVDIITAADLEIAPNEWLTQISDSYPEAQPNVTALNASLLSETGELDQAVRLLQAYEGERNDYLRQVQSTVYRNQARQWVAIGRHDEARALLTQALSVFPSSKTLNLDLVRLEVADKRYEQANILLDDLQSRYPDDPQVLVAKARALHAEKGAGEAYSALRRAWDRQPDGQMAFVLLRLARDEEPEAVSEILAQWEEIAPSDRGRLLMAAEEYQNQGNESGAITAYEQILEQHPNDPVAMNNLAWLLKDKELPRAAKLAEKAAKIQPDSPAILDTYGWLLHLQGENQAALAQLERAVELAPNVEEIQKNLEAVRNNN